jgi:pyruvate kinase
VRCTKIVCTLGPASAERDQVLQLANAGMDVARLNFSHGTHAWHGERIRLIRDLESELGRPIAILQDLSGPKLRIGEVPQNGIELRQGEHCLLSVQPYDTGPPPRIPVPLPGLLAAIQPGGLVFLDDAQIELVVLDRTDDAIRCEVRHGGVLLSRKGITAPGVAFEIAALTPKDLDDAAFGLQHGVDWIAVSFVRRAADMQPIRDLIARTGAATQIIAKIEKPEAVAALDEILEAADGAMVARGDLGVEVPLYTVPVVQKDIIRRCNALGKPVITATQMLESMTRSPRPTRAEVSDVANAIYDGTSAVMLSGETAMGQYPVQTVTAMAAIAEYTEQHLPYEQLLRAALDARVTTIAAAVSQGVAEIASDLDAAAIVCSTSSGQTARLFAQLRPKMPIIAATPSEATYRRLPLLWGVRPLLVPAAASTDERIAAAIQGALHTGWIAPGQIIVIAVGAVADAPDSTNTFRVQTV